MGHRIIVSKVGAADIRKSAKMEFVTELAIPRGRKKEAEMRLVCPTEPTRQGVGWGSQGANQDEMSPCRMQKGGRANTASCPGAKWNAAFSREQMRPFVPFQDQRWLTQRSLLRPVLWWWNYRRLLLKEIKVKSRRFSANFKEKKVDSLHFSFCKVM